MADAQARIDDALEVERMIAAFDDQDEATFAALFEMADRRTLGAVVMFASLAMRDLALAWDLDLPSTRRVLRARVADAIATTQNGDLP